MAWSDIFIPSGNQTASEQQANLDREKALFESRLKAREDAGTVTADQVANDQSYVDSVSLDSQNIAAVQGFEEGLGEGYQNVLAAPGKAVAGITGSVGEVLDGVFKNIPWWVWLLGAATLFVYLGGHIWAARQGRKFFGA